MEKRTFIEKAMEIIMEMDNEEQFDLWNRFCEMADMADDEIYRMEDFDEIMAGTEPFRVACMVHYGDFTPSADYFRFDGYGNISCFDSVSCWARWDEITESIAEKGADGLETDAFDDLLDEYMEG